MSLTNKWITMAHKNDLVPYRIIPIECPDGYSVSIQAGEYLYSNPRLDYVDGMVYEAVELGYPSREDELLKGYAEDPDNPTDTVYGYTPVSVVDEVLAKHGLTEEELKAYIIKKKLEQ